MNQSRPHCMVRTVGRRKPCGEQRGRQQHAMARRARGQPGELGSDAAVDQVGSESNVLNARQT